MVYSTDRSKAVVQVLVLFFVALWFILRGDLLYVFPCVILFLCFSVLLVLRLPRLGKRANLSAFRTFVRFVLVWICRFPLPLGVWEGLRFVNVALPGLFSYLFFFVCIVCICSRASQSAFGVNSFICWAKYNIAFIIFLRVTVYNSAFRNLSKTKIEQTFTLTY